MPWWHTPVVTRANSHLVSVELVPNQVISHSNWCVLPKHWAETHFIGYPADINQLEITEMGLRGNVLSALCIFNPQHWSGPFRKPAYLACFYLALGFRSVLGRPATRYFWSVISNYRDVLAAEIYCPLVCLYQETLRARCTFMRITRCTPVDSHKLFTNSWLRMTFMHMYV